MATTEQGTSSPVSPSEVGRHLRSVRKAKGLSRTEVARSAGLTRRELAAYERGKSPVPDSDLWCLAGSCGVDINELLPNRDRLGVGSDLGALTVGESVRRLRPGQGDDGVLREYLAMIYELRNLPPGTRPPMRDEDLATLADALGGTPDAIEARLHELIGASRDEAARLRSMILPPRPIAAASAPPMDALPSLAVPGVPSMAAVPPAVPVGIAADGVLSSPPAYPPPSFDFATAPNSIGDPAAADRFFHAPMAEDPFAPPPPLAPLESLASPPPPMAAPFSAAGSIPPPPAGPPPIVDPFGPPTVAPIDPFAPPGTPPFDPSETGVDVPRPEGFVADFGAPAADPYGPPSEPPAPVDVAGTETDPWADSPVRDTFAAGEMVVLDVGPDGTVTEADVDPTGLDEAAGPDDAPDDPFAALRVPLDELDGLEGLDAPDGVDALDPFDAPNALDALDTPDGVDPLGAVAGASAAAFAVLGGESPAADETDTEVVEDPGDEWFDRAAAAADALIAEQRVDRDGALGPEPAELWLDAAPTFDASDIGSDTASDTMPDAVRDVVEAPLAVGPEADLTAADERALVDGVDGSVAAPSEPDDPGDALPPISWTLDPVIEPTPSTEVEADAEPAVDAEAERARTPEYVTAGPDWQIGGIFPATAMADDGTLALRRADVRWALADLVADGDGTVIATVNFTSGAGFGILFRVSSDDSERITGYSFDVDTVYSGGGFLLRQWNDSRQHWKPLAHTPVADTARLYGVHVIEVSLSHDTLACRVDGDTVMTVPQLSRASIDAGHEPCRGSRVGVQAWSTTEVTVDRIMLART